MSLFDEAAEQYIDASGKLRMLNFSYNGKGISLMVPPSPPINLPPSNRIYTVKLSTALSFIKDNGLTIDYQDVKDKIKGLWISKEELTNCYIPVRSGQPLKDVALSDYSKMRPLLEREDSSLDSSLEKYKRSEKVAEFLKKYTLYTYSLNPEKFGKKSFVVKENHSYEIESLNNKLFIENNNVFYDDDKLIVTSKRMRDKLMAYLKVCLLNDRPTILNLKNVNTLDEGYKTTADFTPFSNQLIFSDISGIKKWKDEVKRLATTNNVSLTPLPQSMEPYFYRLGKMDQIVIIQNVENGSPELAAKVSYKWLKDKTNKGYYPFESSELPTGISYIAYTNSTEIKHKEKTSEYAPIFFYENGDYAAILKLAEN